MIGRTFSTSERDAAEALRRSLTGPRPTIPPRWFWDPEGARIHRTRSGLADPYPWRTERALYAAHASMLVALFEPREVADLALVASRNVRVLVEAMLDGATGARCALHDVEPARLVASVRRLAADYPRLDVRGSVDDCFGPAWRLGRGGARLLILSGGGPDGLDPAVLPRLLGRLAVRLEPDDALVLGVDLGQDPTGLLRACDDAEGLAAEFHRNALRVINARIGTDFDPDRFTFEAEWDPARRRVETRLRPIAATSVGGGGLRIVLDPARPLVTGRVGTWTREELRDRVASAGLAVSAWLTDPEGRRALVVLQRLGEGRTADRGH